MSDEAPSTDASPSRYSIDALAAKTGVPSRTIRFYQAKGALPAPTREGRVAYYDERHVERLALVAQLQDRGLTLRSIRDLLERAGSGDLHLDQWLGLGDQLQAAWTEDRPRICSEEELAELLGGAPRPGLIAEIVRAGIIRQEGHAKPAMYVVGSLGLLRVAVDLDAAGIDVETTVTVQQILRRRLGRVAKDLAELFAKRLTAGGDDTDRTRKAIEALRRASVDGVRVVFTQEMQRAVQELMERGKLFPPKK